MHPSIPVAPTISRSRSYRQVFPLGLLVGLLVLWLALLSATGRVQAGPDARGFGADFGVFWTAASMLERGANPYDHHALYTNELHWLRPQGIVAVEPEHLVRAGNPPLFFLALRPLADLPFRTADLLWVAAVELLAGLGCVVAARASGWRSTAPVTLLFLMFPQAVLAAFVGSAVGVILAGLALAATLARRRPAMAGSLAAVGWLKPQLVLPLVALIWLFSTNAPRRFAAGFAAATGAGLLGTLAALGPIALVNWFHGLTGYAGDIAAQPHLASLAGLYAAWASPSLRLGLNVLQVTVALAATWWWWRRPARSLQGTAALWFVWFLATPYAHFPDEILLTVPLLVLIGPSGWRQWKGGVLPLYLLFFSVAVFDWNPGGVQLLALPVLGCLAWAVAVARGTHTVAVRPSP